MERTSMSISKPSPPPAANVINSKSHKIPDMKTPDARIWKDFLVTVLALAANLVPKTTTNAASNTRRSQNESRLS